MGTRAPQYRSRCPIGCCCRGCKGAGEGPCKCVGFTMKGLVYSSETLLRFGNMFRAGGDSGVRIGVGV